MHIFMYLSMYMYMCAYSNMHISIYIYYIYVYIYLHTYTIYMCAYTRIGLVSEGGWWWTLKDLYKMNIHRAIGVSIFKYTCTYLHIHVCAYTRIELQGDKLIGCLKLQVIFRKRATNYRALLRKMTYEDKASYVWSPHYSFGRGFVVDTEGSI